MTAAIGLALLAFLLAGVAPRVMARMPQWRHVPGAALLAWQAISCSAVVSALLAGPAALWWLSRDGSASGAGEHGAHRLDRLAAYPLATAVAVTVTTVALVFLLRSGHRVGTRLRSVRRRHRELVDLLDPPESRASRASAEPEDPHTHEIGALREASVRVLEHPGASVYCLPGLRSRVVLSRGALDRLSSTELAAVLAHERAHLQARHDLILEFFTVVHEAVPRPVRSPQALREVNLLVEALADRRATRGPGGDPVALARALTHLAGGSSPEGAAGARTGPEQIGVRLRLIAAYPRHRWHLRLSAIVLSLVVLAAPFALFLLP